MGKKNKTTQEILVSNEIIEKQNEENLKKKKDYSQYGSKILVFIFGLIFLAGSIACTVIYQNILFDFLVKNQGQDLAFGIALIIMLPLAFIFLVGIIILLILALILFLVSHRSKYKTMRILAPIFTVLTFVNFGYVLIITYTILHGV